MASITGLSQLVESGGIEGYTPNQTEYANLSLPMNKRFKPSPAFIFYPKTSEEISSIVRLAAQSGVAVTARGGGHHYGAFSSGEGSESSIIIDLKNFNEIRYDVSREIAVIGAGCRLGQISEELSRVGRALPRTYNPLKCTPIQLLFATATPPSTNYGARWNMPECWYWWACFSWGIWIYFESVGSAL